MPAGHLEIRAQRAAATIRNSHTDERFLENHRRGPQRRGLRQAWNSRSNHSVSRNLLASDGFRTNYDHLFYCACRKVFEDRLAPMVLGRSAEDCKQVLSALVSPFDREVIWHIQGALGEPCPECPPSSIEDPAPLERLQSELVIGHSEYRRAAYTAVQFRRCFGRGVQIALLPLPWLRSFRRVLLESFWRDS